MFEKRVHPRFACDRVVEVAFLRARKPCGTQKATVRDISAGGLRLQFDKAPPKCDQMMVRTGQLVLSYEVRRRYMENGEYFAGVQVITS